MITIILIIIIIIIIITTIIIYRFSNNKWALFGKYTAQKMKFSNKNLLSKCDQIYKKLRKNFVQWYLVNLTVLLFTTSCSNSEVRKRFGSPNSYFYFWKIKDFLNSFQQWKFSKFSSKSLRVLFNHTTPRY